jgi:(p)ppGpp synthase/HD superfamily hydrolase
MVARRAYAQTNLQLFQQLGESGYREDDVRRTRDAHELAAHLFVGSFRGSGKPLLAHLVGTASILAAFDQEIDLIIAGLLHAAYALGDFGDGRYGLTDGKRRAVRARVGATVERLIAHYTDFGWDRGRIMALRDETATLTVSDRAVLTIRLCNELEDHHDGGVLACRNAEARQAHLRETKEATVAIATRLGLATLTREVDRVLGAALVMPRPAAWCGPHDYTFVRVPASCRPRPIVSLRRFCDRHVAIGRLAGWLLARGRTVRAPAGRGRVGDPGAPPFEPERRAQPRF